MLNGAFFKSLSKVLATSSILFVYLLYLVWSKIEFKEVSKLPITKLSSIPSTLVPTKSEFDIAFNLPRKSVLALSVTPGESK